MERSVFDGLGPRIWLRAFCRFGIRVGARMWRNSAYLKKRRTTREEKVRCTPLVHSALGVLQSLFWQVIRCVSGNKIQGQQRSAATAEHLLASLLVSATRFMSMSFCSKK